METPNASRARRQGAGRSAAASAVERARPGTHLPRARRASEPAGPIPQDEPPAAGAAASALRLERPQLLTELAYQRIRDAVVAGELKLGEQVSEAQLAAGMGVSKTPVREALLRLKVEGLVDISPQRGTFVFALAPEQVAQLCRYRAMVETEALREAAAAAPRALVAAMAARVAEMRKAERAKDARALARIDMEFHWQFFEHAPGGYLRAGYEVIRGQLVALRHRSPITNAVSSHQLLVDAVAAGDIEHACALLREHVLENEPRYRAACGRA